MNLPNKFLKVDRFSTPIWHVTDPVSRQDVEDIFDKIMGYHVYQSALVERKELQFFWDYIKNKSKQFLQEMGAIIPQHQMLLVACHALRGTAKELSIMSTAPHTHPESHISGIYFVSGNPNLNYVTFIDPRAGHMCNALPCGPTYSQTHTEYTYKATPGTFIFFPSYLLHQIIHRDFSNNCKYIHFNCRADLNGYTIPPEKKLLLN